VTEGEANTKQIEHGASTREEKLFHEYEQALQIAQHADTMIYEVTAIVWGANTLLLGFILEVPCDSPNQKLVIASSIVGLFLSLYVPMVHWLTKIGQKIAQDASEAIEADLKLAHNIHTRVRNAYPKWRPGKKAMGFLTLMFVLAWGTVLCTAWTCYRQQSRAAPSVTIHDD
jgi:hypothetical protein